GDLRLARPLLPRSDRRSHSRGPRRRRALVRRRLVELAATRGPGRGRGLTVCVEDGDEVEPVLVHPRATLGHVDHEALQEEWAVLLVPYCDGLVQHPHGIPLRIDEPVLAAEV